MSDPTFTIANILQIAEVVSILAGGGAVSFRLGRTTTRVEATLTMQNEILVRQSSEITELKNETKKLSEVLTAIAVQGQQISSIEKRVEELRHGEGFVFPLAAKLHAIE